MIKYSRTLAMTGKSRRDLQQKRGAGRCEAPWDAPKAPMSRGAEMPCRSPPLPGEECASARREFRWNHGLIVRPEPSWLRAFFGFRPYYLR